MPTLKHRTEAAIRVTLIAVVMFNTFAPTSVRARSAYEGNMAGAPAENDLALGITLGETSPAASGSVPLLSEEIARQAQAEAEVPERYLDVWAEPAIYTPGKPLQVHWKLVGVSAQERKDSQVVIHAPDGTFPVDKALTLAADETLTLPLTGEAGAVVWKVDAEAPLPLNFAFDLLIDGKIANTAAVMVDQALFTTPAAKASV